MWVMLFGKTWVGFDFDALEEGVVCGVLGKDSDLYCVT